MLGKYSLAYARKKKEKKELRARESVEERKARHKARRDKLKEEKALKAERKKKKDKGSDNDSENSWSSLGRNLTAFLSSTEQSNENWQWTVDENMAIVRTAISTSATASASVSDNFIDFQPSGATAADPLIIQDPLPAQKETEEDRDMVRIYGAPPAPSG